MRHPVILLALLLAGCGPTLAEKSPLADDAFVTIKGKVLDGAGSPVANAKVGLGSRSFLDFSTLPDVTTGVNLRDGTRTNAQGEYTMTLRGSQAKNSYGQAEDFNLQVQGDGTASGTTVSRPVRFSQATVALADVKLWDATHAPAEGSAFPADQVTLGWTAPPDEAPAQYDLSLRQKGGLRNLYTLTTKGTSAGLPAYLFTAGTSYTWTVAAELAYETRTTATHTLTVPDSVGASLVPVKGVRDLAGRALPKLCNLLLDPAETQAGPEGLTLDLGSPQAFSTVVVFLPSKASYDVQVAGEAGDYGPPLAVTPGGGEGWTELKLAQPATGRYVKLSGGDAAHKDLVAYEVRVLKP